MNHPSNMKPVHRPLVQDFSALVSRSLRPLNLENSEGMAWAGNVGRSVLAVNAHDFNASQVTAFLRLEPDVNAVRAAACP